MTYKVSINLGMMRVESEIDKQSLKIKIFIKEVKSSMINKNKSVENTKMTKVTHWLQTP